MSDALYRRHVRIGVVGFAFAGACWALIGEGLPIQWVVALHEGATSHNVAQVLGDGHHGELVYQWWALLAGATMEPKLASLAALNLGAWLLATCGWFAVAWRICRSGMAAAGMTLVVMGSPPAINAALSESTAALLALLSLLGVAGFQYTRMPSRRARVFGIFVMFCLTTAAALVRYETVIVGAPCLLASIAAGAATHDTFAWWLRLRRRIAEWIPRAPAARVVFIALVLGIAAESWRLGIGVLRPAHDTPPDTWIWSGFQAILPHSVQFSFALWWTLPGAFVAVLTLGWWQALRRPFAHAGLAFSIPLLASVYVAAAHGDEQGAFLEIQRYLASLLPLLLLLAAVGWRTVAEWIMEGTFRRQHLAAVSFVALLGAVTLRTLPIAPRQPVPWSASIAEHGWPRVPLDHDVQREVRWLLQALKEHPRCSVIIPLDPAISRRFGGSRGFEVLSNGGAETVEAASIQAVAEQVKAGRVFAAREGQECALAYHGLDCNVAGADPCAGLFDGLTPLREERFVSRPYNVQEEYQRRPAVTRLSLYSL